MTHDLQRPSLILNPFNGNSIGVVWVIVINYDLDITNSLFVSPQVRYIEVFDITNPQFNEQYWPVPSDFVKSRFQCILTVQSRIHDNYCFHQLPSLRPIFFCLFFNFLPLMDSSSLLLNEPHFHAVSLDKTMFGKNLVLSTELIM